MSGSIKEKHHFDDALETSGFGKYNYCMLIICCLLILTMYMDIFGFSVLLPSVACDFALTNTQQGLLSAIPLIGIMFSSYAWGLSADTLGRRRTLLIAMPIGSCFSFFTSIAPNFVTLCVLKFFSACFLSSANAAGFVLLGESVPAHHRSQFMFLMASATMIGQLAICIPALIVLQFTFHIEVAWLSLVYRPWRLLLQTLSVPGLLVALGLYFLEESPKFLLSKGHEDRAMKALKRIYVCNTGKNEDSYPVSSVFLEASEMKTDVKKSPIQKIWDQTAPLFKPPLLKNSLMLYFILLCSYMTSTGFTMWVPTITNAYFNGETNVTGMTFCEVASNAASKTAYKNHTLAASIDCNEVVKPKALYAVMVYSGLCGLLNLILTFIVKPLGKKKTTLLIIIITLASGCFLLFVKIPMVSIVLFFFFPYVALILGNINTYLVELNPTYLRGMATCLSVVVARGFGFISVQVIAMNMADHCFPMITSYILLGFLGLITAFFLPPDEKKIEKI
ncbi:putative transporter svop-1 [Zerene cesonia]|uniref:putative transporter svop-1 n=1 Tax=Zerene cesonia TaxID=33412 RepID=UPI0018E56F2A|nr:putative transporter svop-1 [Zerene cesonia]XP_038220619.1 putative transporter svop-1 [Zerene cesonia]